MAYQWRRGFSGGGPIDDLITFELSVLHPQEVHRAVWWQVTLFNVYQTEVWPPGASVVKAGLIYSRSGLRPPDPLQDPFADWLDITQMVLRPQLSRSTDVNWVLTSDMGPVGRKGKAMRRNRTDLDESLFLSMHLWGIDSSPGWTDGMLCSATTDALISNVQPEGDE